MNAWSVLVGATFFAAVPVMGAETLVWPDDEWQRADPSDVGLKKFPLSVPATTENGDVGTGNTASFPTKCISQDDRTAHLVFAGDDHFSVRQVKCELKR